MGKAASRVLDLIQRCLRREARKRIPDIAVARIAIEEYLANPEAGAPESKAQITAPVAFWRQPVASRSEPWRSGCQKSRGHFVNPDGYRVL